MNMPITLSWECMNPGNSCQDDCCGSRYRGGDCLPLTIEEIEELINHDAREIRITYREE